MQKTIKVLHVSTHNEDCGIGKYQEMFLDAMASSGEVENKFFDVSPNKMKYMSKDDLLVTMNDLAKELEGYDILHVQHEFSFYFRDEFKQICETGAQVGKKVIVTLHTSPFVAYTPPHLGGLGPRSFLHYAKSLRRKRRIFQHFIDPLKTVDMVIAHNKVTVNGVISLGVDADKVRELVIPVPKISHTLESSEITTALKATNKDVIYCTVGFMHQFKGTKQAIKALAYLPSNYKLAIIGGVHPEADNEHIYDEITDLIRELNLVDRVYITGFVKDDDKMNALIRECDVCVYPYDRTYYSQVSSASLNNSFANYMPTVAYPTKSFKELNERMPVMSITQSCSYYEMAKVLRSIDIKKASALSERFAKEFSYPSSAPLLIDLYRSALK